MEIKEEKIIKVLVRDGVIITTKKTIEIDGEVNNVGDPVDEAYGNWESDRERLKENEPEEIVNAVMAIWGNEPTVILPEEN